MINSMNFATDVDSVVSLLMAGIFAIGLIMLLLPSANRIDGLKPYLAAMLATAVLLFLASALWLLIDVTSPYAVWSIWLRIVCRIINAVATLVFAIRIVRDESQV